MSRTAFVTGGTGAVGKVFIRHLANANWKVEALTRNPDNPALPRGENITYIQGDLDSSETITKLFKIERSYEVIFHLAASLDYFGDPARLDLTNAGGTRTMTDFARRVKARRFVHASSIEAGGVFAQADIPAGNGAAGRIVSSYGRSKRRAEQLALQLNEQGIPAISLRIGNVYGAGWANFVVEFSEAILQRNRLLEYLPLYANRYWSPIHNDDVSAGLLAAADANATGIHNLVGEAATLEEIFRLCAEAIDTNFVMPRWRLVDWMYLTFWVHYSKWRFRTFNTQAYILSPIWPAVHRCYGMDETARALRWRPSVPLRDGIRRTVRWAQDQKMLSR